jgi:hypothetical protein
MMNPNDDGNDPTAYERLTNDAMHDAFQPEELDDPEYVNWEPSYYGDDDDEELPF